MNSFYVGQKVVCINDERIIAGGVWESPLKKGQIYIVRWHGTYESDIIQPCYSIRVEGIYRSFRDGDTPFSAVRFKPLIEKKTDISVFKALLIKSPARITEDA